MAEPVTNPPHECPGKCDRLVPAGYVACENCWTRLPTQLQLAIANGDSSTRLTAVSQALVWYRQNAKEKAS